ncbi:MFS transporter [Actinocatenispora sera]|uniref:MFS transporter n=1 Tax=Actinocatenispora sera TaxID=390989 RepID=A0A810L1J4_9ACTN|nr:MFS transporter [Actinocatenispora sera]BCJ29077.1 MFS transporter [Actinocatenispora sera]
MSEEPGQAGAGRPADPPDTTDDPDRPATYREVFAVREFRAVFGASALSSIGDYLGRVALAALIYHATGSALASAAGFAVTYLPWLTGAPVLVALAERYPYRRVMLGCDLARMAIVAVAAIPGVPLLLLPVLMYVSAMLTPPFDSSRSAMLPQILSGDRYVLGLSITGVLNQATQVGGYAAGGLISAVDPRLALLVDAATFGLSALLIRTWVRARPAEPRLRTDTSLLRDTAEGFTVVFGTPVLRSIAVVILAGAAFAILPEGLAASWSGELGTGARGQGWIMAAMPIGAAIGGVVIGRLVPPGPRRKLIRPLAALVPLSLVAALLSPPLPVVMVLTALTGFAMSVIIPANGLFVQALPNGYRARAFGVMQGGLQLVQGGAIVLAGAVADHVGVARTVGLWSLLGLLVMGLVSMLWPKSGTFDKAFAETRARNEAAAEAAERRSRESADADDAGAPSAAQDASERRVGPVQSRRRTGRVGAERP